MKPSRELKALLPSVRALVVLLVAGAPETLATGAQELDPRVEAGIKELSHDRRDCGLEIFHQVLKEKPDDASSILAMTRYLMYIRQEYAAAEPFARRTVEILPDLVNSYLLLGGVLIFTGRAPQAIALYQTPLEDYPDHPRLLFAAGMANALSRHHTTASELYEKALVLQPQDPLFHFCAGENYVKLQDLERAELHFRRSIQFDQRNVQAMWQLARLLSWLGKDKQAENFYVRALENAHSQYDQVEAGNSFALFLIERRRLEEAEATLKRLVEVAPDHAMSWNLLAQCYELMDDRPRRIFARKRFQELQDKDNADETSYLLDLLRQSQREKTSEEDVKQSPVETDESIEERPSPLGAPGLTPEESDNGGGVP